MSKNLRTTIFLVGLGGSFVTYVIATYYDVSEVVFVFYYLWWHTNTFTYQRNIKKMSINYFLIAVLLTALTALTHSVLGQVMIFHKIKNGWSHHPKKF